MRRITRDIGSAYKANSKDVRARDVQMLFADASTGAHSPALVRQGQISELINAKPKARRRILEEAAGISGLYARRHEAELKLRGAETNLSRVDDVIEQLGNQISQLARQAKQAARYKELGAKLRLAEGVLLYWRWKEADQTLTSAQDALRLSTISAAQAETLVRKSVTAREKCEIAMPPLREQEAIANVVMQRLNVQKDTLGDQEKRAEETIRTLTQRLAQLSVDMDREESLNKDAGETITLLTTETGELNRAQEGHPAKVLKAASEASEAAAVLHNRESQLAEVTEDVARLSARHQSAQRFIDDASKRLTKSDSEEAVAKVAVQNAQSFAASTAEAFEQTSRYEAETIKTVAKAEHALAAAEAAHAKCLATESFARGERAEANGVVNALQAEVSALTKLVDRDRGQGDQILDRVKVKSGYEKALGAALADDLKAPAVNVDGISGWAEMTSYDRVLELPGGVQSFGEFVSVPGVLSRRIAQVGLVNAHEGSILQSSLKPGQRLVSIEGDLWRWDGFRATAKDAPSAAGLRLEQLNRLTALQAELTEVQAALEETVVAHKVLADRLQLLTKQDQEARTARRDADRMMADAGRSLSRAEAERNLAAGRVEALMLAVSRHGEEAAEARVQQRESQSTLDDLDDLAEARSRIDDIKITVEASRVTMMSRRSAHDEARREGEAREKRTKVISREVESWQKRLQNTNSRADELLLRHTNTQTELTSANSQPKKIQMVRAELIVSLEQAEERRRTAADALAFGETNLRETADAEREAERMASDTREERARSEARTEAASQAVALASERIVEELETDPETLLEQLEVNLDKMPSVEQVEGEVTRMRRQRDALGAVNLRAEEELEEINTQLGVSVNEREELEEAIRHLNKAISDLNREGRARMLKAFDAVNSHFKNLFITLFGGGEAYLELTESDDPLDAGLEIMASPPGKKMQNLGLLSGGEQALTALSLIFAVFMTNPSPICVLDEVDAPLDDAKCGPFL